MKLEEGQLEVWDTCSQVSAVSSLWSQLFHYVGKTIETSKLSNNSKVLIFIKDNSIPQSEHVKVTL